MKKMSVWALAALATVALFTSCNKNQTDPGVSAQETEMKAAVEQYVPQVIYKIYGNLADATEELYGQISALKQSGTVSQSQIDKVCSTFLEARQWWEQSEAFLYGAASVYGIDPHIDSWPLDKDKLAKSLSNAETIADLDEEGAGAVDEVGAAS
nr:imelysin [Bacteroidales bacterium]